MTPAPRRGGPLLDRRVWTSIQAALTIVPIVASNESAKRHKLSFTVSPSRLQEPAQYENENGEAIKMVPLISFLASGSFFSEGGVETEKAFFEVPTAIHINA
jgi:hypothetical protein